MNFESPQVFLWNKSAIPASHPENLITQKEKKISRDFKSERRAHQFLWGRYFIRRVFQAGFGIEIPQELEKLERGAFVPIQNYHFSLSHNDTAIAVVIVKNNIVGLDIEAPKPNRNIDCIVDQYGNTFEKSFFKTLSETEKVKYFYKLWTLKESFGKATGLGLQERLKEIELDLIKNIQVKNPIAQSCVMFHSQWENTFISVTCLQKTHLAPELNLVLSSVGHLNNKNIFEKVQNLRFELLVQEKALSVISE